MGLFQQIFSRQDRSVLDLIPIVDYQNDCFQLRDGKVMDILQFTTRDFTSRSDDEIEFDMYAILLFLRLYEDDFKIVSMSFPTDTKEQQEYLTHKLATNKNSVFEYYLNYKLEELKYLANNKTDLEFYLFIWAKDIADLKEKQIRINKSLGMSDLIFSISKEKKTKILFKLMNKNTSIFNN